MKLLSFEDKIRKTIGQYALFSKSERLLCAVSGGVDSMVLLDFLRVEGYDVRVAHCNFKLRAAESDLDEQLVLDYCKLHQISCYRESFETGRIAKDLGLGIQEVARNLRYDFFNRLSEKENLDKIITAHHLDDQLETILMKLADHTSILGYGGIPIFRDKVVRPLLECGKEEILAYAQKADLTFREDSSNEKLDYKRNRYRKIIIPLLKEEQHNLLAHVRLQSEDFRDLIQITDRAYQQWAQGKIDEEGVLLIPKVEVGLNRYFVKQALKARSFSSEQIQAIIDQSINVGGKLNSATQTILADRTDFLVYPIPEQTEEILSTELEQVLTFEELWPSEMPHEFSSNTICVDKEKILGELNLRRWERGDSFIPFGMKGRKKLSDFFIDQKINRLAKENVWLLCDEKNIIWIVGHRMDNRYKVTDLTRKILKIQSLE